jgi:hypothetical protein
MLSLVEAFLGLSSGIDCLLRAGARLDYRSITDSKGDCCLILDELEKNYSEEDC